MQQGVELLSNASIYHQQRYIAIDLLFNRKNPRTDYTGTVVHVDVDLLVIFDWFEQLRWHCLF